MASLTGNRRNIGKGKRKETAARSGASGQGSNPAARPTLDLTPEAEAQESLMRLDSKLSAELSASPFVADTLAALADRRRETAMRLATPSSPLRRGSRVVLEAWGTVYGTTDDGKTVIVLDSDSHRGVILAPKDSELRSAAHEQLTPENLHEMGIKARAISDALKIFDDQRPDLRAPRR